MSTKIIGQLVKERIEALGMKKTEFAKRINTSAQNAHGIFKRKTIDSNLLQKISKVLDYDFFSYYDAPDFPKRTTSDSPKAAYAAADKLRECQELLQEALMREKEYQKTISDLKAQLAKKK